MFLGETWVYLSHRKGITIENGEPKYKPAVLYAFRPKRVEKLILERDATERELNRLKARGITPVIIPDGDKDHR